MHTADASALTPPPSPPTGATLIFENRFATIDAGCPKSAKHQILRRLNNRASGYRGGNRHPPMIFRVTASEPGQSFTIARTSLTIGHCP